MCLVIAPATSRAQGILDSLRWSSDPPTLADVAPDLVVGVSPLDRRRVSTLDFPPGAVLCLYTDGLVERRDQPIDHGIDKLRAAVTTAEPEAGCASVMAAMADYSPHTDDIALLILRRAPGEPGG